MDSYSSMSNTDSSSSASYSFSSNSSTHFSNYPYHDQERKSGKPPPAFRSALHSVRRPPAKNVNITKKQPIAPMPPTPPKIYNVNPFEFKDVVQKLTGAVPTRLREVAPPPLSLSQPRRTNFADHSSANIIISEQVNEEEKMEKSYDQSCGIGGLSPLGFSLSPSSLAWCSAMLLSPGTLASFDPTLVL